MSLYILNENQKLIWDSMNKIPQFQTFGRDVEGKREEWFRDIIQNFYENNKFKLLSVSDLQQLNRDTVSYMIQELKSHSYSAFNTTPTSFFDGGSSASSVIKFPSSETERKSVTRDYIAEQKQEELNRFFSERQQEYGAMLTRGPSQEIDFRMEMEPGPIENMDELVKRQLEYRDAELNTYKETQSSQNPLGVIDLSAERLDNWSPLTPRDDANPKKNVHWSNSQVAPRSILKNTDSKRDELQEFMRDIRNSVRTMQNELEFLKQSKEPIAAPEVLQNPNVSNILSRLRKPVNNGVNDGLSQGLSQDLVDPNNRIVPRNQIYMEE